MRTFVCAVVVLSLAGCAPATAPAPAAPGVELPAPAPSGARPTETPASSGAPTDPAPPAASASPGAGEVAGARASTATTACTRDDECVLSTFPGCCACPEHGPVGTPHALSKAAASHEEELCMRVRCNMSRCGANAPPAAPPEPASNFVARCVRSRCEAIHK